MAPHVPHLYVHVPFCAHRCGYCDFVTTSASPELHDRYVAAVQRELELRSGEREEGRFGTVFIGGGTPTLLAPRALEQLLCTVRGVVMPGGEVTIECNPETVTPALARTLVEEGVTRVSLGAQSFSPAVLATLDRRAGPETVRGAVALLREHGVENLSLDLLWGVPGQSTADVAGDVEQAIALGADHVSAYELDFKPGTRLAHAWGSREDAVGDASDDQYDLVVDTLEAAGYEWYETANFAKGGRYAHHNLGYWLLRDYMGVGIGAVGTIGGERRTNLSNIARYLAALEGGEPELPPARIEQVDGETRARERIMLALRLARPLVLTADDLASRIDHGWIDDMVVHGLADVVDHGCSAADPASGGGMTITLTRRGRMLLNGVVTRLLIA